MANGTAIQCMARAGLIGQTEKCTLGRLSMTRNMGVGNLLTRVGRFIRAISKMEKDMGQGRFGTRKLSVGPLGSGKMGTWFRNKEI